MKVNLNPLFLGLWLASGAAAQEPISGIDWLSQSLKTSPQGVEPDSLSGGEPPTPDDIGGAQIEPITVSPLDQINKDTAGLLRPEVSGIPADFWGNSSTQQLAELLEEYVPGQIPEAMALTRRILLTELKAPVDQGTGGRLLTARLDHLMRAGALDQAQALIELAGADQPELFRRWFDISLLTERSDAACGRMLALPDLSPSLPAQVFCLARSGKWPKAAETLSMAEDQNNIAKEQADLLAWFLDPELFDGEDYLPPANPLTPLNFVMREATGHPRKGASLPLPFLHLDLQGHNGWRAQLAAAERLARAQAIQPQELQSIYLQGKASASGGVWERVMAVQRLQRLLDQENVELAALSKTLIAAHSQLMPKKLDYYLALLFAEDLAKFDLSGDAENIQKKLILLHPKASRLTKQIADNKSLSFATMIAKDQRESLSALTDLQAAILAGLAGDVASELTEMADQGRPGEAVLRALKKLRKNFETPPAEIAVALSALTTAGFEEEARRIAVQLLVLKKQN